VCRIECDAAAVGDGEAAAWYSACQDELATTPMVLAEVDQLAAARAGRAAVRAFRHDAASGAYLVEWWDSAVREAVGIAERYRDLGPSLTDASLVALAARLDTTFIATFDERHFRAMAPIRGDRLSVWFRWKRSETRGWTCERMFGTMSSQPLGSASPSPPGRPG